MLYALVRIGYALGTVDEVRVLQRGGDLLAAHPEAYLHDLEEGLLVLHLEGGGAGSDGHEAGIHLRAGFERGCWHILHDLAVGLVEQVHGEP